MSPMHWRLHLATNIRLHERLIVHTYTRTRRGRGGERENAYSSSEPSGDEPRASSMERRGTEASPFGEGVEVVVVVAHGR